MAITQQAQHALQSTVVLLTAVLKLLFVNIKDISGDLSPLRGRIQQGRAPQLLLSGMIPLDISKEHEELMEQTYFHRIS